MKFSGSFICLSMLQSTSGILSSSLQATQSSNRKAATSTSRSKALLQQVQQLGNDAITATDTQAITDLLTEITGEVTTALANLPSELSPTVSKYEEDVAAPEEYTAEYLGKVKNCIPETSNSIDHVCTGDAQGGAYSEWTLLSTRQGAEDTCLAESDWQASDACTTDITEITADDIAGTSSTVFTGSTVSAQVVLDHCGTVPDPVDVSAGFASSGTGSIDEYVTYFTCLKEVATAVELELSQCKEVKDGVASCDAEAGATTNLECLIQEAEATEYGTYDTTFDGLLNTANSQKSSIATSAKALTTEALELIKINCLVGQVQEVIAGEEVTACDNSAFTWDDSTWDYGLTEVSVLNSAVDNYVSGLTADQVTAIKALPIVPITVDAVKEAQFQSFTLSDDECGEANTACGTTCDTDAVDFATP